MACNETVPLYIFNNTCANDTMVTFNGRGTLSPIGQVRHHGTPQAGHEYIKTLTYKAPSVPATDTVTAQARGHTRIEKITVECQTVIEKSCGDGIITPPEKCDGANLGGQTCESLSFNAGTLSCTPQCEFTGCYMSQTTYCGDTLITHEEQCDGTNLGGQTCQSRGFTSGILLCNKQCKFDESGCIKSACSNITGTYNMTGTIVSDTGGHSAYIGNPFANPVSVTVSGLSITISGQAPFVNVYGSMDSSCNLTATGSGTVAGFPNVSVKLNGSFSNNFSGTYEMGTGGELPGGKSITYNISGNKQ